MKNILKTIAFLMMISLMTGCQKITTEGFTNVTFYPSITILGDNPYTLEVGSTFTDPGIKVMEGDEDITAKATITGTVNKDQVDFYYITYSATNKDGFSKSAIRTVIVYNPESTTDISGNYSVNIDESYRIVNGTTTVIKYSDMAGLYPPYGDFSDFTVDIDRVSPGFFSVNDFYGGYYIAGRGYANIYMMGGYISVNPDNSIELISSRVPGWGDGLDYLIEAEYDPDTDTIKWGAGYAELYTFYVVLNK